MATIEMIMDLAFIAFAVYGIFVLRKWRKCTDQVEEIEGTDCSRGCVIIRLIDADKSDEIIVFDKQNELLQCSVVRDYCKRQREFLNKFPTIDAEPVVHGHWITTEFYSVKCSVCGCNEDVWWADSGTHYCPNCGAKMDEGVEHEAD